MSNTWIEFDAFLAVEAAPADKAPNLVIVNGASSGQTAQRWASTRTAFPFQLADSALAAAGVTPMDVGVAWVKLTNEAEGGALSSWRAKFKSDLRQALVNVSAHYPNLDMIFLSSRVYGGCEPMSPMALNPEPYAYETGRVMKEIVAEHLSGSFLRQLWIGWGPYMWADGLTPRSDGLIWQCSDFTSPGVHPNANGAAKVARMLSTFFREDPVARIWFLR